MTRPHALPDPLIGESNNDWCKRAAESIPAEELMRKVIMYWFDSFPFSGNDAAMAFISQVTGHGSGVSAAIVRRFLRDGTETEG